MCWCGVQEQLVVSSQGYTQETAMSRRVKDWKDQILPELQLQVRLGTSSACFLLSSDCKLTSCMCFRRHVCHLTSTNMASESWQRWAASAVAGPSPPSFRVLITSRSASTCWLHCSWYIRISGSIQVFILNDSCISLHVQPIKSLGAYWSLTDLRSVVSAGQWLHSGAPRRCRTRGKFGHHVSDIAQHIQSYRPI